MKFIQTLTQKWDGIDYPFLIAGSERVAFADIAAQPSADLSAITAGDVVALIGDFTPTAILTLLQLIDLGAIVVPLTHETHHEHDYFFETANVNFIVDGHTVTRRDADAQHPLAAQLAASGDPGLVLFSTGTTGRPKAILHNFGVFLRRFETPRPTLRTLNFLLFDHIGGINTLFHTLFNTGMIVAPNDRTVDSILDACRQHAIEVLPTTPTFLRLMLMSGAIPDKVPDSLRIMTYGTERMDQPTLDRLCALLPEVDFRQTFGMSELGIVRVKSKARDSLFMKVGGEGIETRVVDDVLQIRSQTRMLGYLNAPSPFDDEGWYDTKDIVEEEDGYYKVTGRTGDVINVGGLKFMASEVERVALEHPDVALVKAFGRDNPITGQHVEITVQPTANSDFQKDALVTFLKSKLQAHMRPKRVHIEAVKIGHRFKKA
ncbi:MAG TPA: AMP-dependent synthetase [Gammaproteobacteria bacterium]|nr:AMP-dependent synthetase [Gammaproteobacteria bacterium]